MMSMNQFYVPSTPNTCIGWGVSEKLVEKITKFKPSGVLFVVDPIIKTLRLIDPILEDLQRVGYYHEIYSDVTPEPALDTANHLVDFARKRRYSLVVGIGGGSALDLAKITAVMMDNEGEVSDYLNLTAKRKVTNKGIAKILVPTTAGTGSEVTDIAVLAIGQTKDVIAHEYLKAELAVVDPKLTRSMPPHVTAATGVDALTHAIEAYLSVNANPVSDGLALQAIQLIGGALSKAVSDGSDQEARTAMACGSYVAGLAFYQAGVGAVHALAYPLGGQFHISHGVSNAVMLPYVLSYIHRQVANRLRNILQAMGENTYAMPLDAAAKMCVEQLASLVNEIGIASTLEDLHVPDTALDLLAAEGAKQKRLLRRCPVPLDEKAIHSIYQAAYSGEVNWQ